MKNNKNYCKFVSQVKSSQVKSSAKIISLIALFILLFSISCKPKQNPTPKYSELVGTWKFVSSDIKPVIFTIDSAGNLNLNCGVNKYADTHCNYTGKLADTFEYPYTIELTFNISSHSSASCYREDGWFDNNIGTLNPKLQTGKFTFSDASTCSVSIYTIQRWWLVASVSWKRGDFNNFKKQ